MSFPEVIEKPPDVDGLQPACRWVGRERAHLLERIGGSGALLLRGFPIDGAEAFDAFVAAFDLGRFGYRESLSNAVRIDLTERVFTANEAPADATIRLHHELAQTPAHPRHLFFYCEEPAARGGATALCRSDVLLEALEAELPDFVASARAHGLVYHHVMPMEDDPSSSMGRSWRSTLDAADRETAEQKLATLGYSWRWQGDALAVSSPCLPAVLELEDGRESFFNQLVATRAWRDQRNDPETALRLGNGAPVPIAIRDRVAELAESIAVDLEWQRGDVAILDNHRVQHGRRRFEGRRRILVAFSARA